MNLEKTVPIVPDVPIVESLRSVRAVEEGTLESSSSAARLQLGVWRLSRASKASSARRRIAQLNRLVERMSLRPGETYDGDQAAKMSR
jgi:hypothetical protein